MNSKLTHVHQISECASLLLPSARSIQQVYMDRVFSFVLWPKYKVRKPGKQGRKNEDS